PPHAKHHQHPLARSWSQVASKPVRQSLLSTPTAESNPEQHTGEVIKTSIWRPGHGANSVFIDMSGRKETKESGHIAANCPKGNAHKKVKAKETQKNNFVFDLSRVPAAIGSKRRRNGDTSESTATPLMSKVGPSLLTRGNPSVSSPIREPVSTPVPHTEDSRPLSEPELPDEGPSVVGPSKPVASKVHRVPRRQKVANSATVSPIQLSDEDCAMDDDDDIPELDSMLFASTTPSSPSLSSEEKSLSPKINCYEYLVKSNNPHKQSLFIRYLRSLQFDILAFQETHASPSNIPILNTQLQAQQSLWTSNCG
ncbi:hypothetical protein A0J61_11429, partial [Choanephora cucurbitarum]